MCQQHADSPAGVRSPHLLTVTQALWWGQCQPQLREEHGSSTRRSGAAFQTSPAFWTAKQDTQPHRPAGATLTTRVACVHGRMLALRQQHQDLTPWLPNCDFFVFALSSFPSPVKSHLLRMSLRPQAAFDPTTSTSRRHCAVTLLSIPWKENPQAESPSRTTQSLVTRTLAQRPTLCIAHLFLLATQHVQLTHKTKTDFCVPEELAQTMSQSRAAFSLLHH